MSALLTLGRRFVLGADAFTPTQLAGSPEMTPQQIADLDRKLSPAEQERVSRFQAGQADALQKKEEATPYVDPQTGQKRVAVVDYIPGDVSAPRSSPASRAGAPSSPGVAPDVVPTSTWKKFLLAVLIAGAAVGGVLAFRRSNT